MPTTVEPRLDPRLVHVLGFLVVGAGVVVSWSAQYLPRAQHLGRVRAEAAALAHQVLEIEQRTNQAGGQTTWMEAQRWHLQTMQQRFARSQEIPRLLDQLVERVTASELTLVNLSQGNLARANGPDGNPLTLEGVACLELPVTLTLEGRYHAVRNLLQGLMEPSAPCVATVADVRFVLKDPTKGTLTATIQLVLYVLGS